jgi:hypothetical protein
LIVPAAEPAFPRVMASSAFTTWRRVGAFLTFRVQASPEASPTTIPWFWAVKIPSISETMLGPKRVTAVTVWEEAIDRLTLPAKYECRETIGTASVYVTV